MSERKKKLDKLIALKKAQIFNDVTTSTLVREMLIGMIDAINSLSTQTAELEQKIKDIEKSLNDKEAHDKR